MEHTDELDGSLIPWHWDCVQLHHYFNGMPNEWCEKQNWLYGVDYYFVVTDPQPMYTTEWGNFNISNSRVYNFLFKNPKHATIFRLYWSSP